MARAPLFSDAVHFYLETIGCQEPDIVKQLRLKTATDFNPMLLSGVQTGQMLAMCIHMIGATRILEIGTYTGYATLWMALNLPPEGKIITLDCDPRPLVLAQEFWTAAQVSHYITPIIQDARETLAQLTGPFDLVFIDADKRSYDTYYENALSLLRPGGLIAIDNTLWMGEVADPHVQDPRVQSLQDLNLKIRNDQRVHAVICPLGDGLTLAYKKI